MDVGGATRWTREAVVSRQEMLQRLAAHYGEAVALDEVTSAPADRYVLPDGTIFGIISSTTAPFCADCDRSRLTADGVWLMCLYARAGADLRRPLRAGATRDDMMQLIATVWSQRADRGAEERLTLDRRETLIPLAALKKDAHLEMHTRGG
jgi:cyclic pyranopterin phosphate synthase